MQSVAICGKQLSWPVCDHKVTVDIAGRPIDFALVNSKMPAFLPEDSKFRHKVLVRIDAFSANYRDKSLLLTFDNICRERSYFCFGSEFVGEVVELGADVSLLKVGDRVMGNGSYPTSGVDGVPGGLPTNHASKRYLAVAEARLVKVPEGMPDEVAAAFQIGAQTSYSMIRKLDLNSDSKVLVTAARSNTSLAALHALARRGIKAYALTSSFSQDPWPSMERLIATKRGEKLADNPELVALCKELGGFDAVIDPFFDIYLAQVLRLLKPGGQYVTCGCYRQASEFAKDPAEVNALIEVGWLSRVNNLTVIGNCLGETSDLEEAISDYVSGRFQVTIDRVYRGAEVGDFVERTYNAPSRFGKVVYLYEKDLS